MQRMLWKKKTSCAPVLYHQSHPSSTPLLVEQMQFSLIDTHYNRSQINPDNFQSTLRSGSPTSKAHLKFRALDNALPTTIGARVNLSLESDVSFHTSAFVASSPVGRRRRLESGNVLLTGSALMKLFAVKCRGQFNVTDFAVDSIKVV